MSTRIASRLEGSTDPSAAGAERSEPGGRARRGGGSGCAYGPVSEQERSGVMPTRRHAFNGRAMDWW